MIHLSVRDYCQDCPHFEPAYEMLTSAGDDGMIAKDTEVVCEHCLICGRLEKILKKSDPPPSLTSIPAI